GVLLHREHTCSYELNSKEVHGLRIWASEEFHHPRPSVWNWTLNKRRRTNLDDSSKKAQFITIKFKSAKSGWMSANSLWKRCPSSIVRLRTGIPARIPNRILRIVFSWLGPRREEDALLCKTMNSQFAMDLVERKNESLNQAKNFSKCS